MENSSRPLRELFDDIADDYDSWRPAYPDKIIPDIIRESDVGKNGNVLEIGPGTGQLTRLLASEGFEVLALELGKNLAEKAKNNLSHFVGVRVVNGNFDEYAFPPESFDLVVAATSFHWLDPDSRARKIAKILKSKGVLALIDTHHVDGGLDDFPEISQACYLKYDRNTTEDYRIPKASEVELRRQKWEKELSQWFETIFSGTYQWNTIYSGKEYSHLMRTYSSTISMEKHSIESLLSCIENLIENEFHGKVVKCYVNELFLARKR